MPRTDLSNDLIHWVKGDSDEESFETLNKIIFSHKLIGDTGHIKGGYRCVCFTEAPEDTFHKIVGRYRPFGIRLSKRWLYALGGRPVIYQPESEYDDLHESHRWRHVRYEPNCNPPIDFTWEREWRIQTDELELPPGEARIIVPDISWAEALKQEHYRDELSRIHYESVAYGDAWLLNQPEDFYYAISVINI